ncbi:MAG TPA: DUF4412 domain-containing protein [Thermoanaerobaculia bacterium]|nr:DUF4412 domain-containing protein [Thermoanaerobaculia bacterium]
MKLKMTLVAVTLACSTSWAGDLTFTAKTTTLGKTKSLSTTYMTSNWSRTNSPGLGMDVLTDYQKGITYVINHKERTIRFTKLADLAGFAAFVASHSPKSKQMDAMNARMNDMYGDPSIFKVENTGKEIVMGRSCNKTRITSGIVVWEYSMDPTLRSPISPAATLSVAKAGYGGLAVHPKAAKIMNNVLEATSRLTGFALKTRTSGFGGETDMEVTSVSQGPIAAGTFDLPKGYAVKDLIAESEKALTAR